jgi:hypothetical protein
MLAWGTASADSPEPDAAWADAGGPDADAEVSVDEVLE